MATNIYNNVFENYGLKLDKEKLLWGSIAPDILPKYRFIRHYQDESIDYIVKEIIKVIFMSRYVDFNKGVDSLTIKILSRKIGIISHYLTDFVCVPHAKRWTFIGSMKKHIKYEKELDVYAKNHDFKKHVILTNDIDLYDNESIELKAQVKNYIETVIEEYSMKLSFNNDLDFAAEFNTKISYFILDTINAYSEELQKQFVFEV
nr:zinc dependent phospholipase C family protein [Tissierella sp.]